MKKFNLPLSSFSAWSVILFSFFIICSIIYLFQGGTSKDKSVSTRTSVVYFTDLFHPHDDPDDHFDLFSLYTLNTIDIKAIILDQGLKQDERPGDVPIKQLNMLFNRDVVWGKGLAKPLSSPSDQALNQQTQYQQGIDLFVATLKKSSQPLTVVSVGSLRDIAAAWNRYPDVLLEKINRIYCFIGEASLSSFKEYNVELDQNAFISIMNSGLPIYWVPCFDGGLWKNNGSASYWQTKQKDILEGVSDEVMNFFRFALLEPQRVVNIDNFNEPVKEEVRINLNENLRNLWGAAVFTHAAGIPLVERNGHWSVSRNTVKIRGGSDRLFSFEPINIWVDPGGVVHYESSSKSHTVYRFKVIDKKNFAKAMTEITNDIFRNIEWK